jgi:uncharacterized protein VirK/YbjX
MALPKADGTDEVNRKMIRAAGCATNNKHHIIVASSVPMEKLAIFPTQIKVRLPALLVGVLWRGLTHVGTHRRLLRFLLGIPAYAEFVFSSPSFTFKYLTKNYLVKGLTVADRVSCFLHHYKRLHMALPDSLLRLILQQDVVLLEICEGAHRFTITVGLSRPYDEEGELSLDLRVDDKIVFLLAFTFIPGSVVHSPAAEILLISRLQGIKGAYPSISVATRTLHDVAPNAMLLAALQGIADAFGITEMVAVSAARQSCYSEKFAASFIEAYDDFFTELRIPKNADGFYSTPVSIQGKPITSIKHGHKLRTKDKRAFKQQIRVDCAAFFEEFAPAAAHKLPA